MELKAGYRQTDIGVLPEDWTVVKLAEIADISSGGTPDRLNPSYWGGDIPWVTTSQIDFNLIDETSEFITKKGLDNSAAKVFPLGTLLMAMYGQGKTRGKVAILGINATTNQACAAIKIAKNVSSMYVFFNLSARYEEIRSLSNTGNQENLNAGIIKNILLPIPSLREQHAVAAALSDMDVTINALDQLISKKRDIKQGVMQELLAGKVRLLGFDGEWEIATLGELFEFKNGLNKAKPYFGQGTPIVNYMDVYQNRGLSRHDLNGRVTVTRAELRTYEVQKEDVFFTRTSETVEEIGLTSVIIEDVPNTVFSGFVLRARPRTNTLDTNFKKYCFSSFSIRKSITTTSSYTTRALTNGRLLSVVTIPIPPLPEQRAIAAVLADMDAEIEALEQQREKTNALKRGMMQELLTGKTRLV